MMSVGQWAPRYTRDKAIASAGMQPSITQVRRMRGGMPRPASTARVRKNANDAELCPLGML